MRVRMKAALSGTHDGVDWPAKGGVADLPDVDAQHLVAAGLAEVDHPVEENAQAPATEEKAVPPSRKNAAARKATARK